ncbi:MAG: hypothetical protein JG767_1878, partial [Deferribacteraceae bacterium]|nr:hypothetical protein [Deferribacteraceae bacterium]
EDIRLPVNKKFAKIYIKITKKIVAGINLSVAALLNFLKNVEKIGSVAAATNFPAGLKYNSCLVITLLNINITI